MKIEIEVQRPVLSKFKFKFGTRVKFLNPESTKILELAVEQRKKLKPNLNLRQPPLAPAQTLSCFLMVQLVVKSLKLPGDLSGCSRNKSNISQLVWAIANLPTDLLRLHTDWAGPVHRVPPVVLATGLASSFLVHGTGHWTGRNLRTSISIHTSMTILQKRLLFNNCLVFLID